MVFNLYMDKSKKEFFKLASKVKAEKKSRQFTFGSHLEIEGSGQRKRYLRSLKSSDYVSSDAAVIDS